MPAAPSDLVASPQEMPAGVAEVLAAWLPTQRWFPVAGVIDGRATWTFAGVIALAPGVDLWLLRVADMAVVQVPVVTVPVAAVPAVAPSSVVVPSAVVPSAVVPLRPAVPADPPPPDLGFLGIAGSATGTVRVYDGAHRPELWRAVLRGSRWDGDVVPADVTATATSGPIRGRVLSGEQSNTSFVLPDVAGGLIVKILRTLSEGPHPDVQVPRALETAGFTRAPRVPAALEALVDDGTYLGGWSTTLMVLSTLVPDADDGFTLACALASDGTDFAESCEALGEVVADLHAALRSAYPVAAADLESLPDEIGRRIEDAAQRSAAVRALLGPLDSYLDRLRRELEGRSHDSVRQRIHGDLHLGQTLRAPGGWWVLDFEGEPLRSPSERFRPDLPERDLAGLLRSVDYAAAIADSPDSDWGVAARDGLITGYLRRTRSAVDDAASRAAASAARSDLMTSRPTGDYGTPGGRRTTTEILVDAFELDKAAYEVVYEEQHRPTWAHIPLAALHRILEPFV